MANEISCSVSLQVANDGVTKRKSKSFTLDQTTSRNAWFQQVVGTAVEDLGTPSDVTTPKACIIENLSNTETVDLVITTNSDTSVMTIEPETANFYTFASGATPRVSASANNTVIDVLIASA